MGKEPPEPPDEPPDRFSNPPSPAYYLAIDDDGTVLPRSSDTHASTIPPNISAAFYRKRETTGAIKKIKNKKNKKCRKQCKKHRDPSSSSTESMDTVIEHDDTVSSQLPLGQTQHVSASALNQPFPSQTQTSDMNSSQLPLGQTIHNLTQNTNLTTPALAPSSLSPTINTVTQSVNTPPIAHRTMFNNNDVGPFVVHVEKIESDLQAGTTLHPVNFGRFLFRHQVPNIVTGSIKKIGRNRIAIQFNSALAANKFLDNPLLNENQYKAFIPSFAICKMGFVRGVPVEWSDEEIIELFEVPKDCGKIIKARRLHYKTADGWNKSQSIVLTFDGQLLPSKVFAVYNAFSVELYKYPTIQCFLCCRFGHTQAKCRSKPRCYKCANDHNGNTCPTEVNEAVCIHCQGNHYATDKKCPEFNRQKNIKSTMSEQTISYLEATKLHPTVESYASKVSSYKKTTVKKPRSPAPPRFGFDKEAHAKIVAEERYNSGNGVALNMSKPSNDQIINSILSILSALNITKLDHVAPLILTLVNNIFNNGQSSQGKPTYSNSMELSKH